MKKIWIFSLAALALGIATGLIWVVEQTQSTQESTPVSFRFMEPIPKSLIELNGLKKGFVIERVFLAGSFNNWNGQSAPHQLQLQANGTWELNTNLTPGQIQYKYVLFIKDRRYPVWVQDKAQLTQVDDGFGGVNSVLDVGDNSWWYAPLFYVFLGSAVLTLLMALMEAMSFLVFRYGLSERVRSLMMIWLASVFALGFALFMNIDNERTMAQRSLTDSLNMFHLFLTGQGFNPLLIKEPGQQANFTKIGKDWFFKADARNNPRTFNNRQVVLRTIFLFNRDRKLLSYLEREQETARTAFWSQKSGAHTNSNYFQNYLLKDLLDEARRKSVPASGLFGKENEPMLSELPDATRQAIGVLGFNAILLPIYDNQKIQGYYGALIHPEIFSEGIFQLILMNLIWLLAITSATFVYFFLLPKNKDENLLRLVRFSSRYLLSGREKEVLEKLVQGHSNQEIGTKLFISEGTVKVHVHKIYQKSGVSSRMELLDRLSHI